MEFDDVNSQLLIKQKTQYIEPVLTVSSAKKLAKYLDKA